MKLETEEQQNDIYRKYMQNFICKSKHNNIYVKWNGLNTLNKSQRFSHGIKSQIQLYVVYKKHILYSIKQVACNLKD